MGSVSFVFAVTGNGEPANIGVARCKLEKLFVAIMKSNSGEIGDNAAVHDLGDANLRLLQAAPDRVPYLYEELPDRRVLKPFPIPDEWRSSLGSTQLGAAVR